MTRARLDRTRVPDRWHHRGRYHVTRWRSTIGVLVAGLAIAILLLGDGVFAGAGRPLGWAAPPGSSQAETSQARPTATGRPSPAPAAPAGIGYPETGTGTWLVATGTSGVAGNSGTLLRFTIAVEQGITGVDPQQFAAGVLTTLSDPRGWTGGGQWRLQRVGGDQPHEFTILLATPGTRGVLCGDPDDRYTSCRSGDSVVLNVVRWAHGVPGYGAGLDAYRQYLVNHEVGHRLGQDHELCPGPGRPAPVMQQQTLALHGCTPNPWVYLDGVRYAGPPGQYADPIPG